MNKIINLTPHAIVLPDRTIEPGGMIARCKEFSVGAGTINDIEIIRRRYGNVENLPEAKPDTWYIVSLLVKQVLPERKDLLSPGDLIRDEKGNIIGCKNLVAN
jgi:hypothetical protein